MTHELASAVGLPAPAAAERQSPASSSSRSGDWWRDAVIYQVYVRSFADSDGDGIGDLRGATRRLPYLAELGIDAVWLTPFYASPQADGGYDVADYRAVDPLFGDLADADDLVRTAHELGLRVIVDVVPNHTSDQHPWFRAALADHDPGAARERYHFRPGRGADGELPPNDWESVFGGPAWTRTPDGAWYLHLFAPEQPDLNWDNPEVHEEFDSVLRFWLDLGVDGFRIDVAHGMVKAAGLPDIGHEEQARLIGSQTLPFFDQDGVHEIHRSWRRLLDSYPGERIGVAEAWAPGADRLALYVRPDELHQAFNFQFLPVSVGSGGDAQRDRRVAGRHRLGGGAHDLGAVQPRRGPPHHPLRRRRTGAAPGPRGRAADARAARLDLRLPGRGAGPARGHRPAERGAPGPRLLPAAGQDGFRDGCRVPIPWTAERPVVRLRRRRQLASAAGRLGRAVGGGADRRPALHTGALPLGPRPAPARCRDGPMQWLPGPDGLLALTRQGLVCTLNTTSAVIELPTPGRLLLSSDAMDQPGATARIPADSCAWWAI